MLRYAGRGSREGYRAPDLQLHRSADAQDAGLIDTVQSSQDRVPRELERGWITTIIRLGQGMFDELWECLLADKGSQAARSSPCTKRWSCV